jgi:hypothetical protein
MKKDQILAWCRQSPKSWVVEIPKSKTQTPNKFQNPNSNWVGPCHGTGTCLRFENVFPRMATPHLLRDTIGNLELGVYLDFGIWILGFGRLHGGVRRCFPL